MNRNQDVDDWLKAYDNPMKPVISAIRELALVTDGRISEAIGLSLSPRFGAISVKVSADPVFGQAG